MNAWLALPRYAVECLLCPETASDELKAAWPQLQTQCALIWRARMARSKAEGWDGRDMDPPRDGVRCHVPAPEQPLDLGPVSHPDATGESLETINEAVRARARVMDFQITYCLGHKSHPWSYPRAQWHRLLAFATLLRVPAPCDWNLVPIATAFGALCFLSSR